MNDVMIDLETLGTTPKAPVIAIGAVFFDRTTGELGGRFEVVIDFNSAMGKRSADPRTIAWWMKQDDAARAAVLSGEESTETALLWLSDFLKREGLDSNTGVWGNGATFDITILQELYRDYGRECPWGHWQARDCRTVEALSPIDRSSIPRQGTHHAALDDAIYQAQYISAMIQGMKEQTK